MHININTKVLLRGSLVTRGNEKLNQCGVERDERQALTVEIQYQNESIFASRKRVSFLSPKDNGDNETSKPGDPWFYVHEEFPSATRVECKRFLEYFKEDAKDRLKDYLEWRKVNGITSEYKSRGSSKTTIQQDPEVDKREWEEAWQSTWNMAAQSDVLFPDDSTRTKHIKHDKAYKPCQVPQYLYAYTPPSSTPILQVLPAQIDVHVASAEHHALAVALYLDRKFQRNLEEVGDLWLDVRGAPGWPNSTPFQLIPMIQTMAHHLLRLYPERLNRLIVFPVPRWATTIWKVISKILPAVVTERTILVSGSEKYTVPLDVEKTAEKGGASQDMVQQMENTRNNAMVLKS